MTGHEERARTWRRAGAQSWRSRAGDGDLAEEGAELYAFPTHIDGEPCPACGRRRLRWRIDIALPSPFPVVSTVGVGCTRTHALGGVPSSWADVDDLFAAASARVRAADPFTVWDARHAAMRTDQAARAARLAQWDGEARRLALRLWADDPRLDVESTAVIVKAVLGNHGA